MIRGPQTGFLRILVISLALHMLVIWVSFIMPGRTNKVFFTPVYTTVEFITPVPPKKEPREPQREEPKKEPIKKTEAIEQLEPKRKEIKKSEPAKTPPPEKTIDEALAQIQKKVSSREPVPLASKPDPVEARIKELEKKTLDKRDMKKELQGLKTEIMAAETARKNVKVKEDTPVPAILSSNITREFFDLRFRHYYNTIGSMIQSSWRYADTTETDLNAWLSIRIARDGALLDKNIEKSSGQKGFDESALRAVQMASPFPPLPEGLNEDSLEVGIRFCPSGC
ncbi:MAG: cell envelope integrity protein TolA [Deltaproteobacteria bacterium]|nr:cell envelope integrity protein TolA [Deltaproteobacteria bacterium]